MRQLLFTAFLIGVTFQVHGGAPAPHHTDTAAGVEQAHAELWSDRVDEHGVILDFVGELPTPEDCALGKPNAIGWWSPIEDGPMFTGLYLPAACERAKRSGEAVDKEKARRLAVGLIKCASISEVKGFIVRGLGSDGKCHYPLGSDDQTHPWFYGLHSYVRSDLCSPKEREVVVDKMVEVAGVLATTGWKCPCDGAFKGDFRGGFTGHLFRDAVRYLHMLRAMHEITGDKLWLARYEQALAEKPAGSEDTRLVICAAGYAHDHGAIKGIAEYQQWIYVGCQAALAELIRMEPDETRRAQYRRGLDHNATESLKAVEVCRAFDNADTKVFGDADWRAVYSTWFPQPTQAEAQRVAGIYDKTKRGTRKEYESRQMRNPLAAAAIVALAGDGRGREVIERALRQYDYSKLSMSVFFFAECVYFALPTN
jgi:hypothetical protein